MRWAFFSQFGFFFFLQSFYSLTQYDIMIFKLIYANHISHCDPFTVSTVYQMKFYLMSYNWVLTIVPIAYEWNSISLMVQQPEENIILNVENNRDENSIFYLTSFVVYLPMAFQINAINKLLFNIGCCFCYFFFFV